MKCPDCKSVSYLMVDGQEMSEQTLLRLPNPPRQIKRLLDHKVWCPNQMNPLKYPRSSE